MAGSHRAPRKQEPARLSGKAIGIALVVALIPALWIGGRDLFSSGSPSHAPTHAASPIPPAVTPTPTPTPTATPTKPVTKAPKPLPRVAVSVPRRLNVTGILDVGFDNAITPQNGTFSAASTAEAARWKTRGEPGSPGLDTVYLIGKVYRDSASAFAHLPRVKVGNRIRIRTDSGVLTYQVSSASDQRARGILRSKLFTSKVPGRLVLVGILYRSHDTVRTGQYLVLVARLVAAKKK